MPLKLQTESAALSVVRASGLLQKSELEAVQADLLKAIPATGAIKLLFILENFTGWRRGDDWGDVSFYFQHGDKLAQIAIVGDPQWEGEALMFAGAGLRRAPVKFFPTGREEQARAWLG